MSDTTERKRVDDFETQEEGGQSVPNPKGIVQRWLAEIQLASKTEKNWREECDDIWKRYKTQKQESLVLESSEASFNILWSNTEIIVPALYNSTPTPDVRRRFKDKDPLGKLAATVLERSLIYSIDSYDFDDSITNSVLDYSLTGRGIVRIRYRPTVQAIETELAEPVAQGDGYEGETVEAAEPPQQITDQETTCEHVQWNDFRRGPGKTWSQVPWVAFRHDMTYDDLVEYFGEDKAESIPLSSLSEGDSEGMDEKSGIKRLFQSGEVWEIWDKLKRRVLFITKGVDEPLLVDEKPTLQLRSFFPMPRPAVAILDSTSLIPIPLYRQYKAQAEEIDRLTRRIEKVTYAIRVRGAYFAHVKEAAQVMDLGDNEMVALEDIGALAASNLSLDKLIWIMPVDMLVKVVEALYKARDQVKQTIYEIIGLSDIMRGATKATETLGAQELKSRWGSVRLQRMQKEIQRFVRDILRLKAEVIAEHYEPEVLAEMTQIQLPRAADKQAMQMAAQQAQAAGQEVPPDVPQMLAQPSWEEVVAVLRSDTARQYRIAIETDSTIAETIERDAAGMKEAIEGLGAVFAGITPLQQAGAQNAPQVAKDVALALVRRVRMGRAVEDSVEGLEFGPPQSEMMKAIEQIGQAVQQGTEQIQQLGQKLAQHEQILGQLVKLAQSAAPQPPQRPMMAVQ